MSITIALAGNPNCGKTTVFNALTGSNQFVGNWPGVTVEKKEGHLKGNRDVTITDLPGIYSLSPYTLEEVVARNYLLDEEPDVLLNIIDGTNLERNLYLTTQLAELGIPMLLAVNMMDLVEKHGDQINIDELRKGFGCEVVEISALNGRGIEKAALHAVTLAGKKSRAVHKFAPQVEAVVEAVEGKLDGCREEQKRFFAVKLLESDDKILERMQNPPDISAEIQMLEETLGDDVESIITNERYVYISNRIQRCFKKGKQERLTISDKIDKIVTNRILALPIFAVVMFLIYYLSMSTVGAWATDWTNDQLFGEGWHLFGINGSYEEDTEQWVHSYVCTDELKAVIADADKDTAGYEEIKCAVEEADFDAFKEAYSSYADAFAEKGYDLAAAFAEGALDAEGEFTAPAPSEYGVWIPGIPVLAENVLNAIGCAEVVKELVLNGIVGGVGAVLGFVPQMLVLFLLLAFLEACGYMSRVAFIMDRIFRRFGLSGKSFIPMLIGSGCGVPGIMAARTIENDRDRKMTVMTTTFIPCGAKMPIIALITAAVFGGAWWVAPSAYFVGAAAVVCSGIVLKKTKMFAGDPAAFVMELPAYHLPTVGNVVRSMWERGWSFIKKAGTIILVSSILIWAGSCFGTVEGGGFGFSADMELESSILGRIGDAVRWIFAPLGFHDSKAAIATIMGLVAKEEVVGVFGVLDFEGMGSAAAAYSFLLFNLLCAPCFAALGAIKREMNHAKWFWFTVGYQCLLAYAVSLSFYQIAMLITDGIVGFWTIVAFLLVIGMLYLLFRPNRENKTLRIAATRAAAAK